MAGVAQSRPEDWQWALNMDDLRARLPSLRARIEAELSARDAALLRDHPLTTTLGHFDALPRYAGYAQVPVEVARTCQAIAERAGPEALEDYNKLALVFLMQEFEDRARQRKITPRLRNSFEAFFQSTIEAINRPKRNYYRHKQDAYLKDLAVCRMKLWPCGVELVDECSGFPRSLLLRGGPGQMIKGSAFFLLRANGFSPFFESHFDPRFIKDFTAEGYDRLYLAVAELLAVNPQIKGMIGSSWWHDPALETISPELWFLTKTPLLGGARLFRVGENPVATQDATRFSVARDRLHREGRYNPEVFMLVWLRDDLIGWTEKHK